MSIPADTTMGPVRLVVGDLDTLTTFYARAIGLDVVERGAGRVRLGAGGRTLVELEGDPAAPARPPRTTGLFHMAILVPDRAVGYPAPRRRRPLTRTAGVRRPSPGSAPSPRPRPRAGSA